MEPPKFFAFSTFPKKQRTNEQWEPQREPPIFFTFFTFSIKQRTNEQGSHRGSDRKTGRKTVSRPIFSHANHIPAPCAINRSYQFSRLCNFDSSFFFAWLGHCEWPSINWAVIIYLFPCMGFFALPKWLPKDAPATLQYWILLKNEDSLGVFLKNQRMLSGTIVQC